MLSLSSPLTILSNFYGYFTFSTNFLNLAFGVGVIGELMLFLLNIIVFCFGFGLWKEVFDYKEVIRDMLRSSYLLFARFIFRIMLTWLFSRLLTFGY